MLAMLLVLCGLASAEPRVGVGLVVGDPTGLSLGLRGNAWTGAQAGAGVDGRRFDAHADYLQTVTVLEPAKRFKVPLYVGVGAGVTTAEKGVFGSPAAVTVRVPVGASVLFDRAPVEIFAQAVPTIRVLPGTAFGLDLGVGGRYYF
jgi:hypothetical protein